MRQRILLSIFVFLCGNWAVSQDYTACSDYNATSTQYFDPTPGTTNHSTGAHIASGALQATGTYSSTGQQYCAVSCSASGSVSEGGWPTL